MEESWTNRTYISDSVEILILRLGQTELSFLKPGPTWPIQNPTFRYFRNVKVDISKKVLLMSYGRTQMVACNAEIHQRLRLEKIPLCWNAIDPTIVLIIQLYTSNNVDLFGVYRSFFYISTRIFLSELRFRYYIEMWSWFNELISKIMRKFN